MAIEGDAMRLRRSKLSPSQSLQLCEHFVAGTSARAVAALVGVNKNTAALFYRRLREIIAEEVENHGPSADTDEWVASYFGGNGKGAPLDIAGHRLVFQILRRGEQAYARIVLGDASSPAVPAHGPGRPGRAADKPGWQTHRHGAEGVGAGHGFGSGMAMHGHGEACFQQVSRQLKTYNGIPEQNLRLFLKECEWRLNYGSQADLLETLMAWIQASGRAAAPDRWA